MDNTSMQKPEEERTLHHNSIMQKLQNIVAYVHEKKKNMFSINSRTKRETKQEKCLCTDTGKCFVY